MQSKHDISDGTLRRLTRMVHGKSSRGFAVAILGLVAATVFYSCAPTDYLAQDYTVTGDEFGHRASSAMSDQQQSELWTAYNNKSDSSLDDFFFEWAEETMELPEPEVTDAPRQAAESLYFFLFNIYYCYPDYQFDYAVIQNEIRYSVAGSYDYPAVQDAIENFHPMSSDPYYALPVVLDGRYLQVLRDFLKYRSDTRAKAAREFFGKRVPFGNDINTSDTSNWVMVEHWFTFEFSPELGSAVVKDETPSGTSVFTCIVGPDGQWEFEPPPVISYPPPPPPPPLPITGPPRHPPVGGANVNPTSTSPEPTPVPRPRNREARKPPVPPGGGANVSRPSNSPQPAPAPRPRNPDVGKPPVQQTSPSASAPARDRSKEQKADSSPSETAQPRKR